MLPLLLLAQVYVQEEGGTATLARRLNCVGAALTCSVANGTATMTTAAPTAPGGNTTEVQYNNAGAFGGIASVETDGTRLSIVAETSHPATPASNALHYDHRLQASFPSQPMFRDSFMGVPFPTATAFSQYGNDANWYYRCARPSSHGTTTVQVWQHPTIGTTGSVSATGWDAGGFPGYQAWIDYNTTAAADVSAGPRSGILTTWRGNATNRGGWIMWSRVGIGTGNATNRFAVGLFGTAAALSATADPSAALNSVYFGCSAGETTLRICSNDGSGTATCTNLGAGFPCATNAYYDFWLAAGAFAGSVSYYIRSLEVDGVASGTISSDLPPTEVQLSWQNWLNTGSTASIIILRWGGTCIADNL